MRRRHKTAAGVFAALGDPTRLQLIARLIDEGPQSIASLAGGFNISRQAISKHLRVISAAGLAKCEVRGRETVWELQPHGLTEARRYLDLISHDWDDKLHRLKALVEE